MNFKIVSYALLLQLAACQNAQNPNTPSKPDLASSPTVVEPEKLVETKDNSKPLPAHKQVQTPTAATVAEKFANKTDDVCGMEVEESFTDTCHYKGKVYGFCSEFCKDKFKSQPLKYLSGK